MTEILTNWAIEPSLRVKKFTRLTLFEPGLDNKDAVDYENRLTPQVVPEEQSNLVSSSTGIGDIHFPVLDIDIPHKVIPSSTEGHSHLYFDVPVTWNQYKKLLRLLSEMGILEKGYVDASLAKGATMVRKPGLKKVVKDGPVAYV